MQNPNEQQSFSNDLRGGVNLVYFLAKSHATSITPFCRHSFGTACPGFPGVVAVLMMILTMTENREIQMGWMIVSWFVVVLCHRLRMLRLVLGGRWREHSHYAGWPWLTMRLMRIKDEALAKNVEPFLCLLFGFLIALLAPATGAYVAFGFVSLSLSRLIEFAARRRQVVSMQDMVFEQQDLQRRLRNRR